MKSFEYVVKDSLGIHARPAGLLAKEAKTFSSKIVMKAGEKDADVTRIMAVMAMGIKQGQSITITVDGDDEDAALEAMQNFFQQNL